MSNIIMFAFAINIKTDIKASIISFSSWVHVHRNSGKLTQEIYVKDYAAFLRVVMVKSLFTRLELMTQNLSPKSKMTKNL